MYKRIVVPVDGSRLAECVIPHVDALVKAYRPETVTFVRVVEPWVPLAKDFRLTAQDIEYPKLEAAARKAADDYLKKMADLVKYGVTKVNTAVLMGQTAEQIAEYAKQNKADLIIMSTHGRSGVTRWTMGSVTDRLLHIAPVPVMVVRAPGCSI
jgi:nucleotide-binding universal stress UspA family protein